MKFGVGFNEGAFLTLASTTLEACVTVVSVLANKITIFGGIIVQFPILLPEHDALVISIIEGTVIVTVPLGVLAGRI